MFKFQIISFSRLIISIKIISIYIDRSIYKILMKMRIKIKWTKFLCIRIYMNKNILLCHTIYFYIINYCFNLLIFDSPHRRLETALTGSVVKNMQKRFTSFSHTHFPFYRLFTNDVSRCAYLKKYTYINLMIIQCP